MERAAFIGLNVPKTAKSLTRIDSVGSAGMLRRLQFAGLP
jgi:hypothetical protein